MYPSGKLNFKKISFIICIGTKRKLELDPTALSHSNFSKNQTLHSFMQKQTTRWGENTVEFKEKKAALINMIVDTNSPLSMIDQLSFRQMMNTMDPKFQVPSSAKLKQMLEEERESKTAQLKETLQKSRKVTICLDGWTKKTLSASYLGVSACFFNTMTCKPCHAFLSLITLQHPHTGEKLAECLKSALNKWGITEEKVLMVVTDNGANMIKAIRLMQEEHVEQQGAAQDNEELEEELDQVDVDDDEDSEIILSHVPYRRMACMAHTLQLVVKIAYVHYDSVIIKVRHLVGRVRKSSVAIEKLVGKCGRTVVNDCTTRWNSTYYMISRLLSIKAVINEVLAEIGL